MNNLLSNAFKYTKEGGEISVSIRKGNREAIIEVSDNGTGIQPKDIDNIFNRFYQTETLNNTGTGIGLSLTKGIVELHHGTIEVYSEPNAETTFCIHLKSGNEHFSSEQIGEQQDTSHHIIEENTPEIQQELLVQPYATDELFMKKEGKDAKILIVEDNNALRDMLTKIFETFYTVITAANGKEGLENPFRTTGYCAQ